MTIASADSFQKTRKRSTKTGTVNHFPQMNPFLSPLPSSCLHSKQLSIQNRDANLTSRKLIPQRCATSRFKGWQPWWDLIRRAEKCRCTEKTRGGGWMGKRMERDLKGGKERKGAGLAVDEAIYGHVSGFHCLWRYNGVISRWCAATEADSQITRLLQVYTRNRYTDPSGPGARSAEYVHRDRVPTLSTGNAVTTLIHN